MTTRKLFEKKIKEIVFISKKTNSPITNTKLYFHKRYYDGSTLRKNIWLLTTSNIEIIGNRFDFERYLNNLISDMKRIPNYF